MNKGLYARKFENTFKNFQALFSETVHTNLIKKCENNFDEKNRETNIFFSYKKGTIVCLFYKSQ